MKRLAIALSIQAALVLCPAVSHADPPVASDYSASIVGIEPAAPSVHPSIVGGDSFFALRVDRGILVEVVGYSGEPFLRYLASGEVLENRSSITYQSSQGRDGSHSSSDGTDAPDWHTVGRDGSYAWHDHRTHWMSNDPPVGSKSGDVVIEAVVPLLVDGRPTSVNVVVVWEPPPSLIPAWIGGCVAVAIGAMVWIRRRSLVVFASVMAVASGAATVVGGWQYWSVPSVAGPSKLLVALPVVALIGSVIALIISRRRRFAVTALAGLAIAGFELGSWAWRRRAHLDTPVLPTNAPAWLDRATTAATMAVAVVCLGMLVQHITKCFSSQQSRPSSPPR